MQVVLRERCKTCKNNWDGHCIAGNDTWKAKNSNKEVECEEYEEKERKEVLTPSCILTYNKDNPSNLTSRGVK